MSTCAQNAERLSARIAALRESVANDSLSNCAHLAADVLESKDFAELVQAQRLPPDHVEALLWTEEVLHEAEAHLDGHLPLNSELAENLSHRLTSVDDWLRRLSGESASPFNGLLARTSRSFRSKGLVYR